MWVTVVPVKPVFNCSLIASMSLYWRLWTSYVFSPLVSVMVFAHCVWTRFAA